MILYDHLNYYYSSRNLIVHVPYVSVQKEKVVQINMYGGM